MLPLKYLFENYDLARFALKNWAHDDDLAETLQWFRISSNAVYPYRCNGSLNFLRLSPVQEKCEDNLRAELQHIVYLRAYGYPAMRPVPAHNGELLLTLHTEWGDYFACAFAGVPSGLVMFRVQVSRCPGTSRSRKVVHFMLRCVSGCGRSMRSVC